MNAAAIALSIAQSYQPPPTGVPSRIREADTVAELLQAVEDGNYFETAAHLVGLSKHAVYDWIKRGEQGEQPFKLFADAIKRAEARAEAKAVSRVRAAADDPRFWAAEATWLERRFPTRYGRRQEETNTPSVVVYDLRSASVQVQVSEANPPFRPSLSPAIEGETVAVTD